MLRSPTWPNMNQLCFLFDTVGHQVGGKRRYTARKVSHTCQGGRAGVAKPPDLSSSWKLKSFRGVGNLSSKRDFPREFVVQNYSESSVRIVLKHGSWNGIEQRRSGIDFTRNYTGRRNETSDEREIPRVYRVEAGLRRGHSKGNYDVVLRAPREVERD